MTPRAPLPLLRPHLPALARGTQPAGHETPGRLARPPGSHPAHPARPSRTQPRGPRPLFSIPGAKTLPLVPSIAGRPGRAPRRQQPASSARLRCARHTPPHPLPPGEGRHRARTAWPSPPHAPALPMTREHIVSQFTAKPVAAFEDVSAHNRRPIRWHQPRLMPARANRCSPGLHIEQRITCIDATNFTDPP